MSSVLHKFCKILYLKNKTSKKKKTNKLYCSETKWLSVIFIVAGPLWPLTYTKLFWGWVKEYVRVHYFSFAADTAYPVIAFWVLSRRKISKMQKKKKSPFQTDTEQFSGCPSSMDYRKFLALLHFTYVTLERSLDLSVICSKIIILSLLFCVIFCLRIFV